MMKMMVNVVVTAGLVGGCAVDGEATGEELGESTAVQAASASQVWTSTWNGGSADVGFGGPGGGGYVSVFEGGSGSTKFAYLNLSMYQNDPSSQVCYDWVDPWSNETQTSCYYTRFSYTYGWGMLPTGDAHVTPGSASLHTDLGDNIYGYTCTHDWVNWQYLCDTLAAGGQIDLVWRKDGAFSTFNSGTQQQTWGPYTFKSQGTFRSTSARASGSVLGVALVEANGSFANTRGTSVQRSVISTPNP